MIPYFSYSGDVLSAAVIKMCFIEAELVFSVADEFESVNQRSNAPNPDIESLHQDCVSCVMMIRIIING